MSAKLFNCSPEQLPSDLKANLLAMLQCGVNALEGYIRPGCLHLTLHATVRTGPLPSACSVFTRFLQRADFPAKPALMAVFLPETYEVLHPNTAGHLHKRLG